MHLSSNSSERRELPPPNSLYLLDTLVIKTCPSLLLLPISAEAGCLGVAAAYGVFGPFFVCGLTEDDFGSLPPDQIERFKKKFHKAEILLGVRGNDLITLKVEPKQKDLKPEKQRRPPTQER